MSDEHEPMIRPNVSALLALAMAEETGQPECCLRYGIIANDNRMTVELAVRPCATPGRFTIHLRAKGPFVDIFEFLYFPAVINYLKMNVGQGWRVQEGDEAKVGKLPGERYFSVEHQPA